MKKSKKFRIIAIDGPAGSGKSTTASLVARKLGFLYLDTGAMYRALTYQVLQKKANPHSAAEVEAVFRQTKLAIQSKSGKCRIYLNRRDVSSKLRGQEIESNVSLVSRHFKVRKRMVRLQREFAQQGNLVIEGRDTTSVVFPRADLKIFLSANIEERAKRKAKSKSLLYRQKMELARRDLIDSTREIAPLKRTKGSIVIDTTRLSIRQQVEKVLKLFRQKVLKE